MNDTEKIQVAPEVGEALQKYNSAIEGALAAAQKLEAIAVTAHLAEMFGVTETQTAQAIQKDYLVGT